MPNSMVDRVDRIFAFLLICVLETMKKDKYKAYAIDNGLMFDMHQTFGFHIDDFMRKKYLKAMRFLGTIFKRKMKALKLNEPKVFTVRLRKGYRDSISTINVLNLNDVILSAKAMIKNMSTGKAKTFLINMADISGKLVTDMEVDLCDKKAVRAKCQILLAGIFRVALKRQDKDHLINTLGGLSRAAGLGHEDAEEEGEDEEEGMINTSGDTEDEDDFDMMNVDDSQEAGSQEASSQEAGSQEAGSQEASSQEEADLDV